MEPVIIACETVKKELHAVMEELGCRWPVRWVEPGLHNVPEKLNKRLQELLDECLGFDTVLLAMSLCGNSTVGLRTHDFRLVIPRCDDCITLLLGSVEKRLSVPGTYFLTEGWLNGELNIWKEYQLCIEKYGEERGKRIFSAMLKHYQNLALLDTGCFDREVLELQVREIADQLNLQYIRLEGTLEHLKALLESEWEEDRFIVVPQNSTVSADMCTL